MIKFVEFYFILVQKIYVVRWGFLNQLHIWKDHSQLLQFPKIFIDTKNYNIIVAFLYFCSEKILVSYILLFVKIG